jgi:hypothetical protein
MRKTRDPGNTSRAGKPGASASSKPGDSPPVKAKQEPAGEKGVAATAVRIIVDHATLILSLLGVALLTVLGWAYVSSKRSGRAGRSQSAFAELGLSTEPAAKAASKHADRFSSTKIQAADVHDRLKSAVKTTEVETDREYALVVDEDALKMPPLPDEADAHRGALGHGAGAVKARTSADTSVIESLLAESDHEAAYNEYDRHVKADRAVAFEGEIEKRLSEQLLRGRELKKAASVLEHHVATRGKKEVAPEVFFNLGYIYFMSQALGKSRRFLELFVQTEKDPQFVARATKILEKIKS